MIILLLLACTSIFTISKLKKSEKLSDELFKGPYETTTESMGVRRDLVSIGRNIGNSMLRENPQEYREVILKDFESIDQRINVIRESFKGESTLVDDLKNSIDNLRQQYEAVYPSENLLYLLHFHWQLHCIRVVLRIPFSNCNILWLKTYMIYSM